MASGVATNKSRSNIAARTYVHNPATATTAELDILRERERETAQAIGVFVALEESRRVQVTELEAARRDMSASQYDQEFECSFDAPLIGSYYGDQMTAALAEGRIGKVNSDPSLRVHTWWDLGYDDFTAIWFVQRHGPEVRLIDYYQSSGEALGHYVNHLDVLARERKYRYGDHVFPHDVKVHELTSGRSREETLRSLGLAVDIAPDVSVADGIEAVRTLLPNCWFDAERCDKGIEALKSYRKDPKPEAHWKDAGTPEYRDRPLHDWASHAADAFRYGAIVPGRMGKMAPIVYPKSGVV